ncbi:MAG: PD40 domain-containing protein [Phycisphaerales bacterium]|nr:MAG: PD40 domain-containing protein [Phycisphaerales bacterium]
MSRKTNSMKFVLAGVVVAIIVGGESARADFTLGQPVNLGPKVNSAFHELAPHVSADGLELYFVSWERDGGSGDPDIWLATRQTTEDEWDEPWNLGPFVNSDVEDFNPALSADGLELYFNSFRTGGLGGSDLWVTTRATKDDPWGPVVNLGPIVNSTKHESAPSISADGLELYFTLRDPDLPGVDHVFYVARRETTDAPWGVPASLGPAINSWACQWEPEISSDGLLMFWADFWDGDPRPGGFGGTDLWFSRRATIESEWSEPVNLGPAINTADGEEGPALSADGSTLYFTSNRYEGSGWAWTNFDLWQAPILPVVDFDGDQSVGLSDLLLMVESWETDDLRCDIGPMPWGDGIVNEADLEVLMDYWGQDVDYLCDPKLAMNPRPADGSTMPVDELSWTPGWYATQHDVYLSQDSMAVESADISDASGIYRGPQDMSCYTPSERLDSGATFFWRIDEITADGTISKGHVWSFTVADYLVVDDFESYIVEGDMFDPGQIYMTWWDGWQDPENGSQVGYADPPYVEPTTVHRGLQSMPFLYDNSTAPISRTFREWENPQDWSIRGLELLKLWVYGEPDNSVEPFFITLEDSPGNSKTVTLPDFDPTTESWQQLSIPLSDFVGVDLKDIKRMYMGVGDRAKPGGTGKLLIDDIELHCQSEQ